MKLSVVIPAHNEEGNIPILMKELDEMIRSSGLDIEVILVDDGSTDRTLEQAKEAEKRYPWLKVVRHGKKMGISHALKTGFRVATGDAYMFFPADLQVGADEIPKFVEKLEEGWDLVCGWRQGKYEKAFVSNIYNALTRKLFGLQIHTMNSVKAFRKEVVDRIPFRKDWHRYIVPFAYEAGFTVTEVPIKHRPRLYGESKYKGLGRVIIGLLDLMAVKFQLSFGQKPLLLFGTLGGLSLIIGTIVGLIALYLRFVQHVGYRPLVYLTMLLILLGVSLFSMGFLGEIIANIRDEMEMRFEKLERELQKLRSDGDEK